MRSIIIISFCFIFSSTAIFCGGNEKQGDSGKDAAADSAPDSSAETDIILDTTADPEITETAGENSETSGEDNEISEIPDIKTVKKYFSYRVIGGASMGANGLTITAHNPDEFDFVASMGGYVNFTYLYHVMEYFFFGGFCPMDQILQHLDLIDEKDNPLISCGPDKATMPYEWDWDYNHWHFDTSGGDWEREFYYMVIESIFMATGNMLYYNPDHPFLPPGVPLSWLTDVKDSDKCKNPYIVGKPDNYNAEYNPKGDYPLITFCDAVAEVGCYENDPSKCGENNPDYFKLMGEYDPASPNKFPVRIALAVDYNLNGKRDYGEPVVINSRERFEDTGTDGCMDENEDGKGGCIFESGFKASGDDPNGDNFDLVKNFKGTEGNFFYDKGEKFYDLGLDGVPETVTGFKDYGEGNNEYDYNPYVLKMFDYEALKFLRNAPLDKLERIDFYFDGGIRDAIHAITGAMYFANTLSDRGLQVKIYDDFTTAENSMFPGMKPDEIIGKLQEIDFTAKALGKNMLMKYGNPDATPQEILDGDGKHVGSPNQVLNRILVFFMTSLMRIPKPDMTPASDQGSIVDSSFYSNAIQNRSRFTITLPPGYDDEQNKNVRYPIIIFLPGHGMSGKDIGTSGIIFNMMMANGSLPKFIFLAPEGQCCYRDKVTKKRECACIDGGDGNMKCVDPECKKSHEECEERLIPDKELVQECEGGHFFINFLTDRWGDTKVASVMKYEDAFMELLAHIDKNYRTRTGEVLELPAE